MLKKGILMHSLNNRGVHSENLRIFPNCTPNKMDYRQKMVVPSVQKLKHDEDDDEDLEALRLAALKSLRVKNTLQTARQPVSLPQPVLSRIGHQPQIYNHQRQTRRGGFYQNRPLRQNGNVYHPSRVNQNLIEIVPVEEDEVVLKDLPQVNETTLKSNSPAEIHNEGESKFFRYKDNPSGSEEDDAKESNSTETTAPTKKSESLEKVGPEIEENRGEKKNHSAVEESVVEKGLEDENEVEIDEEEEEEEDEEEEEEEEKPTNDDDDDVLLMADLEEEDSLERLMDEMEREMNVDKPIEKKEKKLAKKEAKESKRKSAITTKTRNYKIRDDRANEKNGNLNTTVSNSSLSVAQQQKTERRSISPRPLNRTLQKRRSLSPKPRLRKKSPRRSPPRRSPMRQSKKSLRETARARSPRKSPPSRFSPRPRSPKLSPRPRSPRLSPRRSPSHRSPIRRSPLRKSSPRLRSPHSRSPRIRRSRSPPIISRSRSPRPLRSPKRSIRSRSPRIIRSRSPRISPIRLSPRDCTPRSKSPRPSPHRLSPLRRASPRTRSPRISPRRTSPRGRSPKISPERRRGSPVRARSPRISPHKSPWSSPRNSPRLSPRRRRSPKESTRKTTRPRSLTPEEISTVIHKKETSPVRKNAASPDLVKSKVKQRENLTATRADPSTTTKDSMETNSNPVLEARRRKFECTKPIDPVNDNKKIKLTKKDNSSKKIDAPEETEQLAEGTKQRKATKIVEDFDSQDSDLCLNEDYVYDVLEEDASDASSTTNAVAMCVQVVPVKTEKERSKKKKKRDKELYQVGKLKVELPLSERIGKDKKCKRRKDRTSTPVESSPEQTTAVIQDLTVDEESDLRTELSRRRAERLNRAAPIQSARLLQSAFKGVVKEVAKTNAKAIQRHAAKAEDKNNKKGVRRVTVLHRALSDLPDSEEETVADSKVPVRFRLGINKPTQDSRDSKASRKSSKRQGRKVKHKSNLSLNDNERKN